MLLIHAGAPDAQKQAEFRDAMFQLKMPRETRIVWNEGEPASAIVTAAEKEGVDLLIAGALEGKDVASRSFLGAVARPLAKLARCSLLLLTHPQIGPNPFRRIVVITDFSDCAKTALMNALWLAEADLAELVQVISIHTPFMQARAEYERPARKREEEEQLLRDFVAIAPACGVPVESKIVDTTTGFAACDFTQSIGAELLVVPAPEHVEGAVPSMMDWALQVTPCSLWIVRETFEDSGTALPRHTRFGGRLLPGTTGRADTTSSHQISWKKAPNNLETHICCSLLLKDPGES